MNHQQQIIHEATHILQTSLFDCTQQVVRVLLYNYIVVFEINMYNSTPAGWKLKEIVERRKFI